MKAQRGKPRVPQAATAGGKKADRKRGAEAPATNRAGGRVPAIHPKWTWHYRTLVTLRARLASDTTVKLHDAAEPLEPHSLHAGDSATDEFDHDVALALLAAEQNALNDVNDAIRRIERGTYGICEASHVPIPAARLRALPWCRYTRKVEENLERAGSVPRPRLSKVVSLRGTRPDIPADGDLPREGTAEDEEVEPEETKTARIIQQWSSLADGAETESKSPFGAEPGPARGS